MSALKKLWRRLASSVGGGSPANTRKRRACHPRLEALEDRQLLSVVLTTLDNGDNLSPTPGSLREAILAANTNPGRDAITFLLGPVDPGRVYYLDDGVAGHVTAGHVTPAPATATDDDHLDGIDPDWRHSWWS